MNKILFGLTISLLCILTACQKKNITALQQTKDAPVDKLIRHMTGHFSSALQAQKDSLFYDINLVMQPIWEKSNEAKWLYVEQAASQNLDKPYRQRVYKVSQLADGRFESSVYELPQPARFIFGWKDPTVFNAITPDSLILREGCAVYLKTNGDCYTGSTNDRNCKSTLRGASYATSIVTICPDRIESWDQGWNDEDVQVWGAEVAGYIFDRNK